MSGILAKLEKLRGINEGLLSHGQDVQEKINNVEYLIRVITEIGPEKLEGKTQKEFGNMIGRHIWDSNFDSSVQDDEDQEAINEDIGNLKKELDNLDTSIKVSSSLLEQKSKEKKEGVSHESILQKIKDLGPGANKYNLIKQAKAAEAKARRDVARPIPPRTPKSPDQTKTASATNAKAERSLHQKLNNFSSMFDKIGSIEFIAPEKLKDKRGSDMQLSGTKQLALETLALLKKHTSPKDGFTTIRQKLEALPADKKIVVAAAISLLSELNNVNSVTAYAKSKGFDVKADDQNKSRVISYDAKNMSRIDVSHKEQVSSSAGPGLGSQLGARSPSVGGQPPALPPPRRGGVESGSQGPNQ